MAAHVPLWKRNGVDVMPCLRCPLSSPFRLKEFSGTITLIDAQLLVQKIGFANVTYPFTFYVATDALCPVVLGLDISSCLEFVS